MPGKSDTEIQKDFANAVEEAESLTKDFHCTLSDMADLGPGETVSWGDLVSLQVANKKLSEALLAISVPTTEA